MRSASESVHLVAATVGFISLFLIWVSVVWGLVLRNGWAATRMRHASIQGIHMITAVMGLTLGLVHGFTQLAVPLGPVRLVDVVVPFANTGDPIGIGIGVVALELMIAAALSVVVQRKLGFNRWRALHLLNHVAFMLLVGHVLMSGSDTTPRFVWGSVLVGWLLVVALWLSSTRRSGQATRRVGERFGVTRRRDEVVVAVDSARCARFGFCEHEAPDVFTLRSDGRLAYRVSVPADLAGDIVRAIDVCPRRAISLNRVPTAIVSAAPATPTMNEEEDEHLTQPRGIRPATVTGLRGREGRR